MVRRPSVFAIKPGCCARTQGIIARREIKRTRTLTLRLITEINGTPFGSSVGCVIDSLRTLVGNRPKWAHQSPKEPYEVFCVQEFFPETPKIRDRARQEHRCSRRMLPPWCALNQRLQPLGGQCSSLS